MIRLRQLDSGPKAQIEERRAIAVTPDTLVSTLRVFIDDVERASSRRVMPCAPSSCSCCAPRATH
jgi:hypothetical protein